MKFINFWKKHTKFILFLVDNLIIMLSYFITMFFLYEIVPTEILLRQTIINTLILAIVIYQIFLNLFDIYKSITRYESGKDYLAYIFACFVSSSIVSMLGQIFRLDILNVKINFLAGCFASGLIVGYRIIIRLFLTNSIIFRLKADEKREGIRNVLIIGAGRAAGEVIRTIKSTMRDKFNIVGIIDDDIMKINHTISGVKILGNREKIVKSCRDYMVDDIFFTISEIDNKNKKEILGFCQKTNAKLSILPSTADIIKGKNVMETLRDVEIEDILGREPIILDNKNISSLIENKVVLVTGGGGSIGSELCRQIMTYNPEKLIIFDIYENNLYDIEIELKRKYPKEKIEAIVGSVRDKVRLEKIFKKYNPYLVFHAAAHKHVPLMEDSPLEAIKNNIFGTYNVANYADKYKAKRFILISTDKAVNPTNIMGASKRMCEMIIQAKAKVSNTEFVAVRFGNVLGSNGSVVPLFKKQIAAGGPVTVTHKEITRFFMMIPEAVGLVLQATTYAKGGEIFVLDMGEPVKIYDLAVSLIKLSGYEPDVDIPIKVTGLRPGEKLYEELLMSEEGLTDTAHNKIFTARPMNITMSELEEKLDVLRNIIAKEDNVTINEIKETMKKVVPTYKEAK